MRKRASLSRRRSFRNRRIPTSKKISVRAWDLVLRPFVSRTYASVPFTVLRRLSEQTMYIPVGGSSVLGAMGYVDATRELAEQIRNGEMPKPDIVIVTLGSGGTVAGIAAGLVAEGIDAKVIGILVAEPPWAIELTARRLTRKVARKIGIPPEKRPDRDLVTDTRYLGRGYGFITPEAELAMKRAADSGLHLDPTLHVQNIRGGSRSGRGRRG